ncbi:phospholipase D-like domain-containing protein [Burkholderia pseudomallei]|uniref:phospholipase D-like domain-containing protein n=1 Tax=Burkholderia pseudomallei TaxID=28450 RepID=UPI0012FD5011|nr:phospholipase D-like domain-containing protein [Burkholderia pseudomallei]
MLLHLKIIVADDRKAIVGSANVTGKGFGSNLEAGVVLGQEAAIQIERVVQSTVTGALVQQIFSTKA